MVRILFVCMIVITLVCAESVCMIKDKPVATQSLVEQDNECSICYDPMNRANSVKTQCKHIFHKTCLHDWANTQKKKEKFQDVQTCPMCRTSLVIVQEPSWFDRFMYFFSCTKSSHSD
jgi:hypothetical protein